MKTTSAIFSKRMVGAIAAFVSIGVIYGQSGNPYDTGMDNPHLNKKTPTPAPSASAAAKQTAKAASGKDQRFLADAGSSFGWEMKTGAVAENKAQNPKTKEIARRMVSSYSSLSKELTALGSKKGVSLAIESAKAQQINGSNYDQSYLSLAKQDHEQTISAFRKASQSADDPDIRSWAKKTLPTLQSNAAALK